MTPPGTRGKPPPPAPAPGGGATPPADGGGRSRPLDPTAGSVRSRIRFRGQTTDPTRTPEYWGGGRGRGGRRVAGARRRWPGPGEAAVAGGPERGGGGRRAGARPAPAQLRRHNV